MVFLALTGCQEKKTNPETYPPSKGDFISNMKDRGTAQLWGIRFEIAEPVGTSAESTFDGGLHSLPEKTDGRQKFTLGEDIEVQLEKVPDSPITFQFNGKAYGTLVSRKVNPHINEIYQKVVDEI